VGWSAVTGDASDALGVAALVAAALGVPLGAMVLTSYGDARAAERAHRDLLRGEPHPRRRPVTVARRIGYALLSIWIAVMVVRLGGLGIVAALFAIGVDLRELPTWVGSVIGGAIALPVAWLAYRTFVERARRPHRTQEERSADRRSPTGGPST
jgi:hypothetical protein